MLLENSYLFIAITQNKNSPCSRNQVTTGWEIIDPYSANFFVWKNYSASIHLIHFKFGTVKYIFMVNVSIVLDFLFFAFLAGK